MIKLNKKNSLPAASTEIKFSNTIKKESMKTYKTIISNASLEKAIINFDNMLDKGIIVKREPRALSLNQFLEKSSNS